MGKRLAWTFVIGGALGVVAQIVYYLACAIFTDPNSVLTEVHGSDTLVMMGILGAILGGLGFYRHLSKRSTFGAGLPFSGFAFGVGENMIHPYTSEEKKGFFASTWKGLWLVIWFNVLVFSIAFFIAGIYHFGFGIENSTDFYWVQPLANPVTGPLLYVTAFVSGGVICCIWETVIVLTKLKLSTVLAIAWCVGALLTPTGIMAWLGSFGGWGADVMVMNGGQICYNVAFMFFNGIKGASFEFAALVLTIGCLFLTGWLTFIIHIVKYGRKPQDYKDLKPTTAENEAQAAMSGYPKEPSEAPELIQTMFPELKPQPEPEYCGIGRGEKSE